MGLSKFDDYMVRVFGAAKHLFDPPQTSAATSPAVVTPAPAANPVTAAGANAGADAALLTQWDVPPAKGAPADPAVQRQRAATLAGLVSAQRAQVPVNPKLRTVKPTSNEPGGLVYNGKPSPRPPALDVPGDQPRSDVNQAIWSELGQREGGVSAVNTWDTAGLTVGAGFAAKHGQLPPVMTAFLRSAPDAAAALKRVGFTCEDGTFKAVNATTGEVLTGNAAIDAIKQDPHVLSLLISLLEDPDNAKRFADAEWGQLQHAAGAVPDAVVKAWPVQTIVMVAHFIHWASARLWPAYAKVGPAVAPLLRMAAAFGKIDPAVPTGGGARGIAAVSSTVLLGSSGHCGQGACAGPGKLPDDIATGDYQGHLFFNDGHAYWHLAP